MLPAMNFVTIPPSPSGCLPCLSSLPQHPPDREAAITLPLINMIVGHVTGKPKVSHLADLLLTHQHIPRSQVTVDDLSERRNQAIKESWSFYALNREVNLP